MAVTGPALTEDAMKEVLGTYLRIPQRHPSAEEMMDRILTCFHAWRVRRVGGEWRVAAQLVERFADLNDNAAGLFATPEEGLNR